MPFYVFPPHVHAVSIGGEEYKADEALGGVDIPHREDVVAPFGPYLGEPKEVAKKHNKERREAEENDEGQPYVPGPKGVTKPENHRTESFDSVHTDGVASVKVNSKTGDKMPGHDVKKEGPKEV